MILENLMDVKFNKDDFITEDKKLKIKDKIIRLILILII